jgi:hypothetical protein
VKPDPVGILEDWMKSAIINAMPHNQESYFDYEVSQRFQTFDDKVACIVAS